MTVRMHKRGHEICFQLSNAKWVYSDDNSPITIEKPCIRCNHLPLPDGEDYCLRKLAGCKGINYACCGHGNDEDAYILLEDDRKFVLEKGDVE